MPSVEGRNSTPREPPLESLRVQGQRQPIGFLRLQKTERSDSILRNSSVRYSAVLRFVVLFFNPLTSTRNILGLILFLTLLYILHIIT